MTAPTAHLAHGELVLDFPFNAGWIQAIKRLRRRRWDPGAKRWHVPVDLAPELLEGLTKAEAPADWLDQIRPHAREAVAIAAARGARAQRTYETAVPALKDRWPTLFAHQREGVAFLLTPRPWRGAILADEMGLGKTRQAIAAAHEAAPAGPHLIACPAGLTRHWAREIGKALPGADVAVAGKVLAPATWTVISYDRLHTHRAALTAQAWECLILDEAHYVKNPRARRTRMVLGETVGGRKPKASAKASKGEAEKAEAGPGAAAGGPPSGPPGAAGPGAAASPGLADRAERVWLLTGTPVANRPLDLFALLRALRHPLGDDQLAFGLKYCNAHQTIHGWDMRGASNVEDLRDRLLDVLLRRTKDEVLDLPPKLRTYMPVEVDLTAYRRVWLAHAEKMYALARARRRYPRRTLLAEIAKLRHAAALAKIPAALALAEEMLEAGEKAVVFTLHRAVVKAFRERFAGRLATVVGGQTSRTRQAQVDAFETDPAIGLLVGDLRAAGHGFTLAAASQVVFVDYAWTPAEHLQAEDRAHRIGQTRAVTVTYLSAVGTIDEDVEQLLAQKLEIAGQLIDGVAPLGRMSFLDDLLAIVAKPTGP